MIRGPDRSGEWALWIPRVLFFPLRVATEAIDYPIRKSLYAVDAYNLDHRVKAVFFNDAETFGIYPAAAYGNRSGPAVGANLVATELFASDFRLDGKTRFSAHVRQTHSLELDSRGSWQGWRLALGAELERRPNDNFWGIGNGDLQDDPPPSTLDPRGGDLFETEYGQNVERGRAALARRLVGDLWLWGSDAIIHRSFRPSSLTEADERIEDVFDVDQLTGFSEGALHSYAELELRYDSRRAPSHWLGAATPTTGLLASGFAGYAFPLEPTSSGFGRYGGELQVPIGLTDGPRVLTLRALFEGITAKYGSVPFYDLPRLGGPLLLRGYDLDTFRDRVATLGSAEYLFDLSSTAASGFLFVDAGRVFASIPDVRLRRFRYGYGGGVEVHTPGTFLGRATIATSSDGGLFVALSFDPVFDLEPRVERR